LFAVRVSCFVMRVRQNLIYDVGASNGDDSAYYLHKGYRVVAVEANPLSLSQLKQRFNSEIRQGRLTLVPLAIAENEGERVYWVCDEDPGRSSFNRSLARGNGVRHHSIIVETCRFASLINRFGRPWYCKIDIEGCDNLCLRDLTPETRPPLISAELLRGDRHIEVLRHLGYTRFKIISQRTFRPPNGTIVAWKSRMPHRLSRRVTNIEARLARYDSDGTWSFSEYSSGPFGRSTRGRWQTADEALELQRLLEQNPDGSDWYDVHAAVEGGI